MNLDQIAAQLQLLETMGLTLPTPAYIAGAVLFGIIGLVAYASGRRKANLRLKWSGVVLMFYPYAIGDTRLLYGIGGLLSIAALCFAVRPSSSANRR